MPSPYFRSPY